jgi:hypothetical protein
MQKLCKHYHNDSIGGLGAEVAAVELIGRLVYEIINGIVPKYCVREGTWLMRWGRDYGHQFRMEKLWGYGCSRLGWLPYDP